MNNQQGQPPPQLPGQFKWPPTGNPPQQGWSIPQQPPYGQPPGGQPQWGYQPPAQPCQQSYHQPSRQPSPPPPRRRSLGRFWLILGVVCALLLASIVATVIVSLSQNVATNNTYTKGTTPAQQVTSTSAQQGTTTPAQRGTTTPVQRATSTPTARTITIISDQTSVVDDIWTVTLNTVQKSSGAGSHTPRPGDIFLIVDVSLKNTSASGQATSSRSAFALQNSSTGQAYTEVTAVGGTPDGTVAAGGTMRGKITYEVPQSVHDFTLQCTPDLTSDASAQWHISI
jgi:hypothetical protein